MNREKSLDLYEENHYNYITKKRRLSFYETY